MALGQGDAIVNLKKTAGEDSVDDFVVEFHIKNLNGFGIFFLVRHLIGLMLSGEPVFSMTCVGW